MPKNSIPITLRQHLTTICPLLIIAVLYLFSLCPNVYLIDSGELATVSFTLGIAHPTGYPLYTLIAYFFAHLPGQPIWNLNILSALFSIAAAAFLFFIARRITESKITPVLTISLFAFSPIIWNTSVTNEVHSLTGLFAILLLFLIYRCHSDRIFYLIMYLTGLSLANHMMIFSLLLPLLVYILLVYRPNIRKIASGFLFLILGLSIYYYLIARTHGGAQLAWGNTINLQRLLWHVSGKQYRVWMFTLSPPEVLKNLVTGVQILARNLLYVLAIPTIVGFYRLYRENRRMFWLLLVILMVNVLYTINYSIPDIESYYIPSFIVLVISFTYGIKQLSRFLKNAIILAISFIIPIINYNSCTLRSNDFGMDFAQAHTFMLPDSSLLITTYWDIYAPLMYSRKIKKVREDLVIIDKELLRRTWYLAYIENEYPDFYERVKPFVNAYLIELNKFEYDLPYSPQTIQLRYIDLLESFVDAKIEDGVFFCSPWPDRDFEAVKPGYPRIPFGLVHSIAREMTAMPFDFSEFNLAPPPVVNDTRLQYNMTVVRNMLRQNIRYLQAIGLHEQAEKAHQILKSF
ncbi:MAG: DUF2723 domain-containing protein [candidate division WOR-3 bacterium]|nr:MAG: DUF2723 domain-containing protein [candidate division WOR-3 bacterium]